MAEKKFWEAEKFTVFPISAKLVVIISTIVLLSLGSIIALVSWLVREDLRVLAENYNFEINRRSAMETEYALSQMRSDSIMLIQMLNTIGKEDELATEATSSFFEQNPQVASLSFSLIGNEDSRLLVNQNFFDTREIDSTLANSYHERNADFLKRAALGETILLNATPHFTRSVVAMFFPWQGGGGSILLSTEHLENIYGSGVNRSYLINYSGDILIHSDFDLVRSSTNIADLGFIQEIQESEQRNRQMLVEEGDNGTTPRQFVAYTKLSVGGSTVITNIEYATVFESINATTRRNIYLAIMVLFVSIMLIWFFAKSISVPLKDLTAAMRIIESGIFDFDLKPKSRDEIGILTASFRKMCSALGIFGKFTNRDIALRAMRGEIKPGGVPKHATVFFSDIRGFTTTSENFTRLFGDEGSERIVLWLNNYLTRMVECVEKTGGAVDKFVGDAVLAHWGAINTTGSPQKDAFRCVFAALMMRKAVHEMNKKCNPNDFLNPAIQIGCGINTGIVTAGQIGSDKHMEYTVIGDPVNLASRVESLNKQFGTDILITENTWKLVKNWFITEEMPPVLVAGKKKAIRVFAVINLTGANKSPRTLLDLRKLLGIEAPDDPFNSRTIKGELRKLFGVDVFGIPGRTEKLS